MSNEGQLTDRELLLIQKTVELAVAEHANSCPVKNQVAKLDRSMARIYGACAAFGIVGTFIGHLISTPILTTLGFIGG